MAKGEEEGGMGGSGLSDDEGGSGVAVENSDEQREVKTPPRKVARGGSSSPIYLTGRHGRSGFWDCGKGKKANELDQQARPDQSF